MTFRLAAIHVSSLACLVECAAAEDASLRSPIASVSRSAAKSVPDLFLWTDACNVYVLRDGDAALMINLGDGGVFEKWCAFRVLYPAITAQR